MFRRLILMAVRSYIGGPAKSWVFTTLALMAVRLIRRVGGRREIIELSPIKPGQTIVIEHLPISHKRQMKDFKQAKRQARRSRRRAAAQ